MYSWLLLLFLERLRACFPDLRPVPSSGFHRCAFPVYVYIIHYLVSHVNTYLQLFYLFFHVLFDISNYLVYNHHERGDCMPLTMGEKIKVILNRRNMTLAQLAEKTNQSRQNLSNKMSRDNFTEKELYTIAEALDCTYSASLIMNDTGEEI